ncbi:MAG: TetR/AcrR family transcriptional regulator [Xylanivirga thermophila]|uniref:TetR/AcrR family transcriptional regulator n=1 Tax=Xylanivirga thermophila TaxID=2496273 RepID=UPI0039F540DF
MAIKSKKSMILDAATHMFSKKGFYNTSIDEIAEYAGIGKGTVYQYFESKEALFLQVFEHNYERYFLKMIKEVNEEHAFMDKLYAFIYFHEQKVNRNIKTSDMMFKTGGVSLKAETQKELQKYICDQRTKIIDVLKGIFECGQQEGCIKDIDCDFVADIFYDMVIRHCMRCAMLSYGEAQRERDRQSLMDMLMEGIHI